MATATTSSDTSSDKSSKAVDPAKLDSTKFKFGPPPIQTAEDATMAFLREEISEEEFRAAMGKFGILPGQIMKQSGERVDTAFKNTIPDDIYDPKPDTEDTLDARLKAAEDAQKERDEAAKNAENNPTVPAGTVVPVEAANPTSTTSPTSTSK